jgi:hypothetical protein
MSLRRAAAILAFALAADAPGAAVAPQGGQGFVVGAVVDAATGRGIHNAIVRASGRDVTQTRLTDELGRFYLKYLPEGDFTITAQKAGYVDGAYGKQRAGGDSIPLSVSIGVLNTFVRIPMFRPAVISGTVADEGGDRLVGVPVRAVRRQFVDGVWQLTHVDPDITDDEGAFRLFGLVPGEYLVFVPSIQATVPAASIEEVGVTGSVSEELATVMGSSGVTSPIQLDPDGVTAVIGLPLPTPPDQDGRPAAYRTQYYPGGDRLATARSIIVGPSEHHGGVFFQMLPYPTTRVSGVVLGPDGPAQRQVLRLLFADDDDTGVGSEIAITLSGPDGSFTFASVPAGRYRVDARGRPASAVPVLVPGGQDGSALWGHVMVAVGEDPVEDLVVAVNPAPAVAGRIVFEASGAKATARDAAGVSITLAPANGARAPYVTRADGSGNFSFAGVIPGDYTLKTTLAGGWFQKGVRAAALEATTGLLEVDANRDIEDVVVTVTDRPSRLIGIVRDARTFIAPGAVVIAQPVGRTATAVPDPRRAKIVRASSRGVYQIDALPPGEYALTAIDDASLEGWQDTRRLETWRASGVRVVVKDGEIRPLDLRVR